VVIAGTEIRVTASIGLAFAGPESARNATALITTADEALYQAKADGRNRVAFGHGGMYRSSKKTESAEFTSLLLL
jgi:diguanylate cyclase (GGDEF)-like protein